ncbi:hypothetical protein EPJ70_07070 [Brachyspira aalborgi]|uniref:Uncharacterized protein n=1 Tax=Brachyspira aalborgi TaxID=29522 RepID=A0A5C8F5X5_9SPIR|nr:hypothetical protein [Brachyspira aalborgi]TXJ44551.1 hypothetical protein EPJ70_07070 [Brachyspira aalborgi]
MEITSKRVKNIYNPLISFAVLCILLLAVIIGISIIYDKNIIAYICLMVIIIIIIVCIVDYFIILNKDPNLLHDESYLLEMKRHERIEFKIENGKNNLSVNINKPNEIKKDNDNENH